MPKKSLLQDRANPPVSQRGSKTLELAPSHSSYGRSVKDGDPAPLIVTELRRSAHVTQKNAHCPPTLPIAVSNVPKKLCTPRHEEIFPCDEDYPRKCCKNGSGCCSKSSPTSTSFSDDPPLSSIVPQKIYSPQDDETSPYLEISSLSSSNESNMHLRSLLSECQNTVSLESTPSSLLKVPSASSPTIVVSPNFLTHIPLIDEKSDIKTSQSVVHQEKHHSNISQKIESEIVTTLKAQKKKQLRCCDCRESNRTFCHSRSCRCRSAGIECKCCRIGNNCRNEFKANLKVEMKTEK